MAPVRPGDVRMKGEVKDLTPSKTKPQAPWSCNGDVQSAWASRLRVHAHDDRSPPTGDLMVFARSASNAKAAQVSFGRHCIKDSSCIFAVSRFTVARPQICFLLTQS